MKAECMGQGVILCFIIFIFNGVEASLPSLNAHIHSIYMQTQELNHYTKLQVGNGAGERQKFYLSHPLLVVSASKHAWHIVGAQ